jgi:hypothetical protein
LAHVRFRVLYREAGNDHEKVNRPDGTDLRCDMPTETPGITQLLVAWGHGDEAALHLMIPLVQRELQQIARRCMGGERAGHTLQPTALVNEAYLRLIDVQQMNWQNRAHFFASTMDPPTEALAPASTSFGGVTRAPVTWRRGALIIVALIVALAGGAGAYLATRGAASAGATFAPLTTTGNTWLPAISSDGTRFVYVQRDDTGESLWIQQTSTRNPPLRLVEAQPGVRIAGATITPDGESVDFLKRTGTGSAYNDIVTLMRVSSTSVTTPQRLIDNVGTPVAYSPDGNKMAFIRQPPIVYRSVAAAVTREFCGEVRRPSGVHAADGPFHLVTETTARMLSERRTQALA